jgi:peptidoglycan/xylan/chitin deacetylase (PgdA/CDA1 family)
MKNIYSLLQIISLALLQSCSSEPAKSTTTSADTSITKSNGDTATAINKSNKADNATILAKQQVPILCYHHITNKVAPALYTVSIDAFNAQLKILADSGYHTVLPEDVYNYLNYNAPLPSKPVMLTFDDTRVEHYTVAAAEMKKYNFKGVFFIMTIAIGKPNYMSSEQIKTLHDEGHTIGSHTWDHQNLKKLPGAEFVNQIDKPKQKLESITGAPIVYFAYPFGLWGDSAVAELKKRDTKAAFQLTDKRKEGDAIYTIRRMIVPGGMKPQNLLKYMRSSF